MREGNAIRRYYSETKEDTNHYYYAGEHNDKSMFAGVQTVNRDKIILYDTEEEAEEKMKNLNVHPAAVLRVELIRIEE